MGGIKRKGKSEGERYIIGLELNFLIIVTVRFRVNGPITDNQNLLI